MPTVSDGTAIHLRGRVIVGALGVGVAGTGIVGTSSTNTAILYPSQQKSFHANGRFWVFYSDGSNMVYSTSTDGLNWSAPAVIKSAAYGYDFGIFFDGTYLHYAFDGSPMTYRRGLPNADGTITWSTAEQTVPLSGFTEPPAITVDSSGYVWIAYIGESGATWYPFVTKSGNNDGTWGTTPPGFPYQLSATGFPTAAWLTTIVPLTSGKMLVLYAYAGTTVKAQCWNGSAWNSETTTTSNIRSATCFSAISQADKVHLAFLKSTGYDILYAVYDYSTNSFGSETTVQAGATINSSPVISKDSVNNLYIFWAEYPAAAHIYYSKNAGSWSSPINWIDESTAGLTNDRLTCFFQTHYIGLLHMNKKASPYNVCFNFLSVP